MQTLAFDPQSRSLLPRTRQRVTLEFFDLHIPGSIESVERNKVRFRAESLAYSRVLRPQSRVRTTYFLAQGVVEAQFLVLGVDGQSINLQLSGELRLKQRRRHPRVEVSVPTLLVWSDVIGSLPRQVIARTRNLSLGGALLKFDDPLPGSPSPRTTVLVELGLPDGPLSTVAKFVQIWDDGARIRILELDSEEGERLADFLDMHLM